VENGFLPPNSSSAATTCGSARRRGERLETNTWPVGYSREMPAGKGLSSVHHFPTEDSASRNALSNKAEGMLLKVLILTGGSYPPPLFSSHFQLYLQFYYILSFVHKFCVKKLSTCNTCPRSCAPRKAWHMPRVCGTTGHHLWMTVPCAGYKGPQGLFWVPVCSEM